MRTNRDRRNKNSRKKSTKENSYQNPKPEIKILHPKTRSQELLMESIDDNILTLCTGAAGTGKTLIALYMAIQMYERGLIDQILFVRPVVDFRGERGIGFLPGELEEKIDPLLAPIKDNLQVFVSPGKAEMLFKRVIKFELIEYIRGRSLRDKFVIFDESQNGSKHSLLTVISRLEESSKLVILGDAMQSDVLHQGLDGLSDALYRLEGADNVGIVKFKNSDIVRAAFLQDVIRRYQK